MYLLKTMYTGQRNGRDYLSREIQDFQILVTIQCTQDKECGIWSKGELERSFLDSRYDSVVFFLRFREHGVQGLKYLRLSFQAEGSWHLRVILQEGSQFLQERGFFLKNIGWVQTLCWDVNNSGSLQKYHYLTKRLPIGLKEKKKYWHCT